MSEQSRHTCASESYLRPSWWCHPCGTALRPKGCYPEGNLTPAECAPLASFDSHQTSRTRHCWTGRFCRCEPRWRQLPPGPPAAHFSSSCPSQRWAGGNQTWPQCLWRPNTETLERRRCDDIFGLYLYLCAVIQLIEQLCFHFNKKELHSILCSCTVGLQSSSGHLIFCQVTCTWDRFLIYDFLLWSFLNSCLFVLTWLNMT